MTFANNINNADNFDDLIFYPFSTTNTINENVDPDINYLNNFSYKLVG